MTEIRFAGQLTEEDFRKISALAGRKIMLFGAAWMLILVLFLGWTWGRRILEDPASAAYTFGPLLLIVPFFFAMRWFTVRRHWRSNKIIQRPISGSVSEDGIAWEVEGLSSTRFPWNLLLRYRDSPSLVLVYQGLNQVFYFFPRFFADGAQWEAFRALVSRKLPRK